MAARRRVEITGTFVSTPEAFSGIGEGLRHVLKQEIAESHNESGRNESEMSLNPDLLLVDLVALSPFDLDGGRIVRDCELVAEAVRGNPREIVRLAEILVRTDKGKADLEEAFEIVRRLGLSEEQAVRRGGGLLQVFLLLALTNCAHCQKKPPKPGGEK
jgi:hypothetical protein